MHRTPRSLTIVALAVVAFAAAHPFELVAPEFWAPAATQAVAAAETLHAALERPPAPDTDLLAWLDAFADALGVLQSEPQAVAAVAAELRRVSGADPALASDVVLVLVWRGVLADLALLAAYVRDPAERPAAALPAVGWPAPSELGPEIEAAIARLERLARGGAR